MAIATDKKKKLQGVLAGINKSFGAGTVNFVSDVFDDLKVRYLPTPSKEVNAMLGGGVGVGRIVEFFGEHSAGKTSFAQAIVAYNQKLNPEFTAGQFETEGSFDPDYAKDVQGIDMDRFIVWEQKDTTAEKGLDILRGLVASGEFNMILVNSVAGLTPKAEVESEMEKANVASQARIMSKLMRVITGVAYKNKCTLIFINQLRTNVGVMYGDPNVTSGGRALAFYASQRVNMRKVKPEAKDPITEEDGGKVHCKTVKNRLAKGNPYKQCDYFYLYGVGIDSICCMPDLLEEAGIVIKKGSWYNWKDEKGKDQKINSKTAFTDLLRNDEQLRQFFEAQLEGTDNLAQAMSAAEMKAIAEEEKALEGEFEPADEEIATE